MRADLGLRWSDRSNALSNRTAIDFPSSTASRWSPCSTRNISLREEAGESPKAAEYQARFPDIADSFHEVIEIHDLLGRARLHGLASAPASNGTTFPEAGQTIAGFRLVEELGRGAFARVYLAEEQHLADRPVALKVTPNRFPRAADPGRLQHTHIVPVYSYRTDPATGLHLLCMPYLGRVTLLQILNHPELAAARTGADLLEPARPPPAEGQCRSSERDPSRAALVRRTYSQAIAWWGARWPRRCSTPHDRQVLHRDIKPSNVLVSSDGLPMLLDFNLAQEPLLGHSETAHAGVRGTLAYMAPEQLESLAEGGLESTLMLALTSMLSVSFCSTAWCGEPGHSHCPRIRCR